jgi:hypothetical protein
MAVNQILQGVDLSEYLGEWVAVSNKKVIAHNKNLMKIKKAIDNCKTAPTIAKIPKNETLIF